MKKLLFLYPIAEYIDDQILFDENNIKKMDKVIDVRYRQKGYEINYLLYSDKGIKGLSVMKGDRIIYTDISFSEFMTCGEEDWENYPSNEKIAEQIGETTELVICGFHADDCVKRVAGYFCRQGVNTLVDVELTNFFRIYSKYPVFKSESYNLANIIEYLKAENISLGCLDCPANDPQRLFQEAFYQLENFIPEVKCQDILKNYFLMKKGREFVKEAI